MTTSIFFAQIMSITMLILGFSMFLKRPMLLGVFHELAANRAFSYILGTLMTIIGLFVVLQHNVWTGGFSLLITFLGWGALLEGTSYLFLSQKFLEKYFAYLDSKRVYYSIALTYLVLGSYLASAGF